MYCCAQWHQGYSFLFVLSVEEKHYNTCMFNGRKLGTSPSPTRTLDAGRACFFRHPVAASCSIDQHVSSAIWWIFQGFSEIVPPKFCVKTTRCEGCQRSQAAGPKAMRLYLPRWRCFFGLSKHHRCGGCEVAYNWAGQREIAWENAWEGDDYGGKLGRQT